LEFRALDITKELPFEENSFDVIRMRFILVHVGMPPAVPEAILPQVFANKMKGARSH
jgi:hypothetical protein